MQYLSQKVLLLVLPGVNFDRASFFETCSHNRGFTVNAFTDYEKAMRWLLSSEDTPNNGLRPIKSLSLNCSEGQRACEQGEGQGGANETDLQ